MGERLPPLDTIKLPTDAPIGLDTETTGLDWVAGHRPVGLSVAYPGHGWYLPWAHEAPGEQYPADAVRQWAKDNLQGRHLFLANAKFDVHMLRAWGLDLEALGCSVHDIQFHAALLDERRRTYSLDGLAHDFVGQGKAILPNTGVPIHERSAAEVAPYAVQDAVLTLKLAHLFTASLDVQGLRKVADLEDSLIYCTCEMERNGARLDVDKLEQWKREIQSRYLKSLFAISNSVGAKVNVNSTASLYKLLVLTGNKPYLKHKEKVSVTYEDLKRYAPLHPAVQHALDARRYSSLLSRYIDKYLKAVGSDNIIRYNLNQMRSDQFGTVTGRYSSTDINIQQVFNEEHQEGVSNEYIIRELFLPEDGKAWVSADASQIEFRLFGHYSQDPNIVEQYTKDPMTDFHAITAKLTGLSRRDAKTINFGRLYGMGKDKMFEAMTKLSSGTPPSREVVDEMFEEYNRRFPAVRRMVQVAQDLADRRGYVKTFLGRRRRFERGLGVHAALNAVIQGTAADVMKLKLLELYNERKELGLTMRFTVHDEVDGDLPADPVFKDVLKAFLDYQSIPLRVPLLWTVDTGENWRLE